VLFIPKSLNSEKFPINLTWEKSMPSQVISSSDLKMSFAVCAFAEIKQSDKSEAKIIFFMVYDYFDLTELRLNDKLFMKELHEENGYLPVMNDNYCFI